MCLGFIYFIIKGNVFRREKFFPRYGLFLRQDYLDKNISILTD